jgi:phosphohistidine swiveling domain-containing protein
MRYIITKEMGAGADRIGGKAAPLAALARGGLRIPLWFALTADAFYDSLPVEAQRALSTGRAEQLAELLRDMTPAAAVLDEMGRSLREICPPGGRVAVRSSAIEEDGTLNSFAGQLETFLFVSAGEVPQKIAAIWRSAFSARVFAYRLGRGIGGAPRAPAVLVQQMVNPQCAGVAFGADPVTGQRGIAVVNALYGLGTALVSGECDADVFHVDREGCVVRGHVARKTIAHCFDAAAPDRISPVAVENQRADKAALTDEQIVAVAALARRAGRLLGRPQDIEWAIENGELYLLQSRPITALASMPDPDGARILWDNSNIVESYGGVTTPLTFSFARKAYTEVYRRFSLIMGVPDRVVGANAPTFANMLGLIQGRVYYNLMSWYRVLALLPGFRANRCFMEQMMGVKETLPEAAVNRLQAGAGDGSAARWLQFIPMLAALVRSHFTLESRTRAFNERLERALAAPQPALEEMRADELVAHYRTVESELLTRWDAPLVNDFLCMVFFGVLKKLCRAWCNDRDGTLQNDLLRGESGMVSAEPAQRLVELARIATERPGFPALLREGSLPEILDAVEHFPEFNKPYRAYLERFGERCLDELKLESETLHDDPLVLLRAVGACAQRSNPVTARSAAPSTAQGARDDWCAGWLRRRVFNWVLRHARARVRERENLRFARTRVFGRVRRIFIEFGKRFEEAGLLETPRDVFYLEVDEVLGFVEGTVTSANLAGLAALRKQEFGRYHAMTAPPSRFETRGMVNHAQAASRSDAVVPRPGGEQLQGLGCSSGVVRGPVRVVRDPRAVKLNGEILVAERTDPGWVTLFPSASGLLVERGSLLSHSAIVARELALPAIVALTGVTRWLKDGDWVEFDGATGIVRRVQPMIAGAV